MRDFSVDVRKEFNKHHNLARVQEKFPELNPETIMHFILDTTVSKNRTRYDESAIKKIDITTDIKPITVSDIIAKKEDVNELSFIANDEPCKNFTSRKTINYQELFYMVLVEGRSLEYLLNVLNCNEYSILKGLQFLHAEAKDEVIKAKIIEYSNIYFFKA